MRKLRKSKKERMVAGVCGGIAEYFKVDVTLIRIAYILISVLSAAFPGILIYLILWAVIPVEKAGDTEVIL